MNHSVKSKTIRHDCHLRASAAHSHPQTLAPRRWQPTPRRHRRAPRRGRRASPSWVCQDCCCKRAALFRGARKRWEPPAGEPAPRCGVRVPRPGDLTRSEFRCLKTNPHVRGNAADPRRVSKGHLQSHASRSRRPPPGGPLISCTWRPLGRLRKAAHLSAGDVERSDYCWLWRPLPVPSCRGHRAGEGADESHRQAGLPVEPVKCLLEPWEAGTPSKWDPTAANGAVGAGKGATSRGRPPAPRPPDPATTGRAEGDRLPGPVGAPGDGPRENTTQGPPACSPLSLPHPGQRKAGRLFPCHAEAGDAQDM